jgi:glycosyltransferase involved in cell wall biosynthesis
MNTDLAEMPSISVIIPAFNEAGYISETLKRLSAAEQHFKAIAAAGIEILVVDNASMDATAELARNAGATVVYEAEHNVAKVRNSGAAAARHDILVFLDADTLVPPELLLGIARAMTDPQCVGGSVDISHRPVSRLLRAYLVFWRVLGLIGGMAQGACQFCRKSAFKELGGYDETWYMGEDVDFYWRLKRLARRHRLRVTFIGELQVVPSPRRFDQWPIWRTLVWTFPPLLFVLKRNKAAWGGWYREPPR